MLAPFRLQDATDGCGEPVPFRGFGGELLAAGGGQRIEACLAVIRGDAPFGGDPAALLQTLERRIESAVLDEELFIGSLLNRVRDSLAVLRAKDERAEDEQVESALKKFEPLLVAVLSLGRHLTGVCARLGKMSTGTDEGQMLEAKLEGKVPN